MTPDLRPDADLKLLAFDIFGTVVDWQGSIAAEVARQGWPIDGGDFARAWRAGYQPAMARVRRGERGWVRIDALHREILDEIAPRFGLDALDEAARHALNLVWHRLAAWPDSAAGLAALKTRYTITTLSNGNLSLLTDLARHNGLPWDCVLSAEVFRAYKPDPAVYLGAAEVFDLRPDQVMLVAAHHDDLAAARACGLRTAYVERPLEFGPGHEKDVRADAANTLHARDLLDLARQLGASPDPD